MANRGGRRALHTLTEHFIVPGILELTAQEAKGENRNCYRFGFPQLSAHLRAARDGCTIEIAYENARLGDEHETLRYDDSCEWLFFDTTELIMSSRRIDVTAELRKLLGQGKGLWLQCFDSHEQAQFEDALADVAGDKLKILLAGPAGRWRL